MAARGESEPGADRPAGAPGQEILDARLSKTRLLALDVDGVLTDGRIVRGPGGKADEYPAFDVQDGIALLWMRSAGVAVAWISGRTSLAVDSRARELGVQEIHLAVSSKSEVLRGIQERLEIAPDETVAMGDDLPDLGLRARSGFFAAPANARPEILELADLVTSASGGRGAVRELCERILRAQGRWQGIVDGAGR